MCTGSMIHYVRKNMLILTNYDQAAGRFRALYR